MKERERMCERMCESVCERERVCVCVCSKQVEMEFRLRFLAQGRQGPFSEADVRHSSAPR